MVVLPAAVFPTVIHVTVNYFTGLYEREPRLGRRPWWPRIILATGIGVAVQGLAFVVLDRYLMPRLNLAAFMALASFVLVFNRGLARRATIRRQGYPWVVLAGDPDQIELAAEHLAASGQRAVVADLVEQPHRLVDSIVAHEATDVLLLDVTAFGSVYPEPLSSLELAGVGFLQRVSARETLLGLRTVREIGGMPFVALRSHTVPSYKVRLKRVFDLVVVIVAVPLWIPLVALIALIYWAAGDDADGGSEPATEPTSEVSLAPSSDKGAGDRIQDANNWFTQSVTVPSHGLSGNNTGRFVISSSTLEQA